MQKNTVKFNIKQIKYIETLVDCTLMFQQTPNNILDHICVFTKTLHTVLSEHVGFMKIYKQKSNGCFVIGFKSFYFEVNKMLGKHTLHLYTGETNCNTLYFDGLEYYHNFSTIAKFIVDEIYKNLGVNNPYTDPVTLDNFDVAMSDIVEKYVETK